MLSVGGLLLETARALRGFSTIVGPSEVFKLEPSFTVSSSGTFTATIGSRSAIAIHTGATGTGSGSGSTSPINSTIAVTFQETATTTLGEVRHVFIHC